MKGVRIWVKELEVFFKRHVLIVAFCIVSIFIVTKASGLPVWSWLPKIIKEFFVVPESGSVAYEVLSIFNNLSFAYIASFITYILIQYIPERKKTQVAYTTLKGEISRLYSYMSRLIAMYLYELKITKPEKDITFDDVRIIAGMKLDDEEKLAKIRDFRNGVQGNTVAYKYNLCKDSKSYAALIGKTIKQMTGTPCFTLLDPHIINLISIIENNGFCCHYFCEIPPYKSVFHEKTIILNFDKNFYEFVQAHIALSQYEFDKISYQFSFVTEDEVKKRELDGLFMANRRVFEYLGAEKARAIANEIVKLKADEETLRKSEGVLLEMLVVYDACPEKFSDILFPAQKIAQFIYDSESNAEKRLFTFLNCLQVKKRISSLSEDEKNELMAIIQGEQSNAFCVLGASILLEQYDVSECTFSVLSDSEKQIFTQFPIYRLWPNPPMPPEQNPRLFTVH